MNRRLRAWRQTQWEPGEVVHPPLTADRALVLGPTTPTPSGHVTTSPTGSVRWARRPRFSALFMIIFSYGLY